MGTSEPGITRAEPALVGKNAESSALITSSATASDSPPCRLFFLACCSPFLAPEPSLSLAHHSVPACPREHAHPIPTARWRPCLTRLPPRAGMPLGHRGVLLLQQLLLELHQHPQVQFANRHVHSKEDRTHLHQHLHVQWRRTVRTSLQPSFFVCACACVRVCVCVCAAHVARWRDVYHPLAAAAGCLARPSAVFRHGRRRVRACLRSECPPPLRSGPGRRAGHGVPAPRARACLRRPPAQPWCPRRRVRRFLKGKECFECSSRVCGETTYRTGACSGTTDGYAAPTPRTYTAPPRRRTTRDRQRDAAAAALPATRCCSLGPRRVAVRPNPAGTSARRAPTRNARLTSTVSNLGCLA